MKYPRIVGWSVVVLMWVMMGVSLKYMKQNVIHHNQETNNSIEEMMYWVEEDLNSGDIDSGTAETYIEHLEEVLIDLGVTR